MFKLLEEEVEKHETVTGIEKLHKSFDWFMLDRCTSLVPSATYLFSMQF